jgi:hypothetical protein
VTSKLGRTLGRPRSRASFLGHPGTSAGEGWARFPPPPGPPPPRTALRGRWPIDADAPWKSHGRHRRTARTEPSTAFSTELGKPANGRRFPTSVNRPAALRRGAFARSLFPNDSDAGDTINPSTQSGQAQWVSEDLRVVVKDHADAEGRFVLPKLARGHYVLSLGDSGALGIVVIAIDPSSRNRWIRVDVAGEGASGCSPTKAVAAQRE